MCIIKSDQSDLLIRTLLVINKNQFDLTYARKGGLCDEETGVSHRIQAQNTARLQEELVKVRKANRNPESAFCSSLLLSAKPFYSSFLLSSFLCCSVGGGWLPMTLSFVAKFQPLENVSCHLNSKFPKTLVWLTLDVYPHPVSHGHGEGLCWASLFASAHPWGGDGKIEERDWRTERAVATRADTLKIQHLVRW